MKRKDAQKGTQKATKPVVKGELSVSTQNVGVVAVGAAITAFGNYAFNDQPAQKQILTELADVKQKLNQMMQAAQYQIDFINATKQAEPGLKLQLDQIRNDRQLRESKVDHLLEVSDKLKAKAVNKYNQRKEG